MAFRETSEVKFDAEGLATHKACGEKLVEVWHITRTEVYSIQRDDTTKLVEDYGDDKECDGMWCEACDVRVEMEKE